MYVNLEPAMFQLMLIIVKYKTRNYDIKFY